MTVPSMREAGRAFRSALYTPAIWNMIAPLACGWLDGGCAILADAVVEWLGVDAAPMVITDAARPHHVVARYGDLYFDGDGISTKRALLARWHIREGLVAPRIEEFDASVIERAGIVRDPTVSASLAAALAQHPALAHVRAVLTTSGRTL